MDSTSPRRLTVTQLDQLAVESRVAEIYQVLNGASSSTRALMMELWRDKHVDYLTKGLGVLAPSFKVLDASRPWMCYWLLHSLALLGEPVDDELEENIVDFLSRCQDKTGGYGGGPGQLPHLATTYAAVNALVTLGTERALSSISREKTYSFLLRMKDSSGGFRMHDAGEMDVRASYTAISANSLQLSSYTCFLETEFIPDEDLLKEVSKMPSFKVAGILKILDKELATNVGHYILSCQTYEGGIAGEPGSEAHGGYTFCGLAAMILINEASRLDLPSLIDWVAFRQGVECGFQGRTNKLVDGCYSFWQGATLALVQRIMSVVDEQLHMLHSSDTEQAGERLKSNPSSFMSYENDQLWQFGHSFISKHCESGPLFQTDALQQYILLCSQALEGGLKDKPGKSRDFYHSCYCLSGLSICQHSWSKDADDAPLPNAILGGYSNLLLPIHPLYNVVLDKYREAYEFF